VTPEGQPIGSLLTETPWIGIIIDISQLLLGNNKPKELNQLRTSRKFKVAAIANGTLNNSGKVNGLSLKPKINPDSKLFQINDNSNSNIRQSYDSSNKNNSLRNLNTIGSKKSMRSQHRRRKKSREEEYTIQNKRKRDSRLFKKGFGGAAIKLNLNHTGISLNPNALKNYKLPIWDKPLSNKAKLVNESLLNSINYKPGDLGTTNFNTHNTIETFRGTSRKEKDKITFSNRPNEDSKMMNSARIGKQIRLKKNLKRFSNNNRYKVTLPNGEEEYKAKSHSRNRSKRTEQNVNTSLVVNRTNVRNNFFKEETKGLPQTSRVQAQRNVKNKLLNSLEAKPSTQKSKEKRIFSKPMTTKDSKPDVKQVDAPLNESKSEAKTHRTKNKPVLKTLDSTQGNNKLKTSAVNEIKKTIQQLKSWRSPNSSAFTNPQAPKTVQSEKPEFPLGPGKALKLFMGKMSDYEKGEILDYRKVYFLGLESKKIKGTPKKTPNYGYDSEQGDYKTVIRDHIAYRYEVLEYLGKGSFGQALKWFDHKTNEYVALKIIRNQEKFQYQASVEVKVLQHIKDMDTEDTTNLIRMKDYFVFRSHVCIVFELLSMNLYEFIKNTDFRGVSMGLIRRFAIQLLHSLKFIKEQEIIHWDLKPENILLKTPTKSGIKIIDFGSSWFMDEIVYTYIQSRFYRAPEIMLGIPYTASIDMWSFGCIAAELFWGLPLFPGESEREQMSLLIEILDVPNDVVIAKSPYKHKFFDKQNKPYIMDNIKGEKKIPNSKPLPFMIEWDDEHFLDFIERWLDWDPETRMTPDEALRHIWILEGLPKNVLYHHWKMYDIEEDEVKFYTIILSLGSRLSFTRFSTSSEVSKEA